MSSALTGASALTSTMGPHEPPVGVLTYHAVLWFRVGSGTGAFSRCSIAIAIAIDSET